MVNPLTRCVQEYALPPYAELRPDDYAPALREAIEELKTDLAAIEEDLADPDADISWESVMDRVEIIDDPLDRLWGVVTHMSMVGDVPELRAAQALLQPEVLSIQGRRAQSIVIYRAMVALRDSAEWNRLTPEQQRILTRAIQKAKHNGVRLADNDKERFNAIHRRLLELRTVAINNLTDATKAYARIVDDKSELQGVPLSTLALMAQNAARNGYPHATAESGPWKLSLESSVYQPILKHCTTRRVRQELFLANNAKASVAPYDNEPVVLEMLRLRSERARLLGFATYADLCLADKMAPSATAVTDFLHDLRDKCFPIAQAEHRRLEKFAAAHNHTLPLEPWDVPYWREQLRNEECQVNDEQVKPYFSLPKVLEGLFQLASQLFGIRIEAADGAEETWHPDVRFYQIREMEQRGEPVVAQFYLDLYSRPGEKVHMQFLNVVASRSTVFSTQKTPVRVPVVAIGLNQTSPNGADSPCLMTADEVHALFHMFGSMLRIALSTASYSAASGAFGVEWDAIEVAATAFSMFSTHRATMALISGHYDTGATLPDELLKSMVAANRFMSATDLLRNLESASLDLALHQLSGPFTQAAISTARHDAATRFGVAAPFADDKSVTQFFHLFDPNYASVYYGYKWSEVLARDAFACFEETEQNPAAWEATGRRFRATLLGQTGIRHPEAVFESFRGRKHSTDALLKHYGLVP